MSSCIRLLFEILRALLWPCVRTQLLRVMIPQRGDRCRALPWHALSSSATVPSPPGGLAAVAASAAASQHLPHALVKFFIDIEFTGSHTGVRALLRRTRKSYLGCACVCVCVCS